eukprot:403369978
MVDQSQEKTYKFVGLTEGNYQIKTETIPEPASGEVLIKVAYSTINPYDKYLYYVFKPEKIGSDVGKKVSLMGGAWTQYKIDKPENLIILDETQDLAKAANAQVNPLTALGQLHIVQQRKSPSCIMTAASSQLAKQFYRLCHEEGIEVINIVRKDEQVRQLKQELNAKYVLNQTSETFYEDVKELIELLKPTIMFDYIGGVISGKLIELMPLGSQCSIVGTLTEDPLIVNTGSILFQSKSIVAFSLFNYLQSLSNDERQAVFQRVSNDLRDGGKIFGTNIVKEVSLEHYLEGMEERVAVASEGKILINCQ